MVGVSVVEAMNGIFIGIRKWCITNRCMSSLKDISFKFGNECLGNDLTLYIWLILQ